MIKNNILVFKISNLKLCKWSILFPLVIYMMSFEKEKKQIIVFIYPFMINKNQKQ